MNGLEPLSSERCLCYEWAKGKEGGGGGRSDGFNGLIRGYMLSAWPVSRSPESRRLEPTQAQAKLMGSVTRRRLCNQRFAQSPHQVCAPWGPGLKAVTDTGTTWTGLHTQTREVCTQMCGKVLRSGFCLAQSTGCRWVDALGTWKGAPILTRVACAFLWPRAWRVEWPICIQSPLAFLEVFQLGFLL